MYKKTWQLHPKRLQSILPFWTIGGGFSATLTASTTCHPTMGSTPVCTTSPPFQGGIKSAFGMGQKMQILTLKGLVSVFQICRAGRPAAAAQGGAMPVFTHNHHAPWASNRHLLRHVPGGPLEKNGLARPPLPPPRGSGGPLDWKYI